MNVLCDAYVDGGTVLGMPVVGVCKTCGWGEKAHDDETRRVIRGEHPESMPDGRGGFVRRPRFGPPMTGGRYA